MWRNPWRAEMDKYFKEIAFNEPGFEGPFICGPIDKTLSYPYE
jgi:hypothetical protein